MKRKNVFFKAGILLLSLLLLPGLVGCGAISSLMATPTPTPTLTPTATSTPTPTPTPTLTPTPTPPLIVTQCKVIRVQGASEYEFNVYAGLFYSLDGSKLPMVDALVVDILGETGQGISNRNVVHGQSDRTGVDFTVTITDVRTYLESGSVYELNLRIYYSFKDFKIVDYEVEIARDATSRVPFTPVTKATSTMTPAPTLTPTLTLTPMPEIIDVQYTASYTDEQGNTFTAPYGKMLLILTLSKPSGICSYEDAKNKVFVVDSQRKRYDFVKHTAFYDISLNLKCTKERFEFVIPGSDRYLQLHFFDMEPIDLSSFLP